jgi:hypothetical protein
MYADDVLYIKPMDQPGSAGELQKDVTLVVNCISDQGQQCNVRKTEALLCTLAKYDKPSTPDVLMYGQRIVFKTTIKYLGVVIDARLNYYQHNSVKVKRARQMLGAACGALQSYGQFGIIGRIWSACILPTLVFSAFITHNRSKQGDDLIKRVQMRAARASANMYTNDAMVLQKLGWQSFEQIVDSQRLRLAYMYSQGLRRLPLDAVVVQFNVNRNRETRRTTKLHSKQMGCHLRPTTATTQKCAVATMTAQWNTLTQDTVDKKLGDFKRWSKRL